jgi:hypothetical protein
MLDEDGGDPTAIDALYEFDAPKFYDFEAYLRQVELLGLHVASCETPR